MPKIIAGYPGNGSHGSQPSKRATTMHQRKEECNAIVPYVDNIGYFSSKLALKKRIF